MKCKVKRDMKDEKRVRTKNGRSGISGICTVCGGKMFKMLGGGAKATGKAKVPSKQRSKKAWLAVSSVSPCAKSLSSACKSDSL
jgi:hypothetical protein